MRTRRSLLRALRHARHDQRGCIALAVETMASKPYASPEDRCAGLVPGYMTRAAELTDEIDAHLDRLSALLDQAHR
jgi:hypothetical protein